MASSVPSPSASAYADAGTPVVTTVNASDPPKRPEFTPATFAVIRASDRQQQRRLLRQTLPATEPPEPERANDWAAPLFGCCDAPAHLCVALLVPWATAAYVAHHMNQSGVLVGLFLCVAYTATLVCLPQAQQDDGSWHLFASDVKTLDFDDYKQADSPALTKWDVVVLSGAALFLGGVALLRVKAREFYDVRGWSFCDCCASAWCSCCVLAQMSVHTRFERAQRRGDDGGDGQVDGGVHGGGGDAADPATLPAY